MASTNIINAVFGSGICAVTTSAYRANYGMVLRFSGIELPTAFECDFSNYDTSNNDSITAIGQNGEVQIPDQLWDSGLNIYAYVYLHPTDDSGVTVYTVTIPVLGRPNRTEEEPTPHEQTLIEQAISALNSAVEQTAADVASADASAQAAAQSEANASVSERAAAASAGAALASQNAAESASQSATESASGAAESARNAANSAAQAAESATNAQASAEQAEQSAQSIEGDVERAEQAATTATDKATEASASAATASGKANEAAQSASSAASAAQNAAESEQSAQSHATDAETAKQAAETAQAAAEQAKDDAVTAADRAEQAEQEVLSAMDGTYENLTSGNAQQLLSTVTEANSVPYLFRPTAANADRAYLDEVVGGTVAWNQLVVKKADRSATFSGVTYTWDDGVCTLSGAVSGSPYSQFGQWENIQVVSGHKYLFIVRNNSSNYVFKTVITNNVPYDEVENTREGFVLEATGTGSTRLYLRAVSTSDFTCKVFNPMVFDLTQMFGSTIADYIYSLEQSTAGAGVAYFRKLFPKDYYEYNAGELISVGGVSSHETVGFNLFDRDASVYGERVDPSSGRFVQLTYGWRSGYIFVSPGEKYYLSGFEEKSNGFVAYYDTGKNFIMRTGASTFDTLTITTPQNCCYIVVTQYNNVKFEDVRKSICINLSDPTRNGEYEPYTKRTYPLDSSLTLRGIPKLDASGNLYYDGDTYAPDGAVTRRYGIVDLGTLSWVLNATNEFAAIVVGAKGAAYASVANAACGNYLLDTYNHVHGHSADKTAAVLTNSYLYVYDTAYTDVASFKAAMSGVMLVYELATPTTETATPYRHLQICDPNGTEEFVSTGIVPVGHNTRYPENLRAKIEGLPWNFNAIIAMTETTTTASKAYSVGDYFILNNVLYRVTSAIASGGTITIGTNCRATTIMDEIKALS